MIFAQPVTGAGLKETADFAPGMHEIAASPFADSHSGIGIFVKRSTVIICQRVSVHCKMYGNEIHDHADSVPVAGVNEGHQLGGCAVPRSGTVESGCLIAPGFITGVFVQRHDLQIVISVFQKIGDQDIRHLFIIIPVVRLFGRLAKRAEMDFVYIQRCGAAVTSVFHPFRIAELISVKIPDHGSRAGTQFHTVTIRIAVIDPVSGTVINPVFVHHTFSGAVNMAFPEVAVGDTAHRCLFPPVEFADERNPRSAGSESPEGYPVFLYMSAQIFPRVKNFSCIKSVKIHVSSS